MAPQDFVIYALTNSCTAFGRRDERTDAESDADVLHLWAPDLLPRHCCVRRLDLTPASAGGRSGAVTLLKPLNRAKVKRNGAAVSREVELQSGDVVGLGDHYLFMYKDPTSAAAQACTRPPLCQTCVLSEKTRTCFRDPEGAELVLLYDVEHESRVLEEIFTTVDQEKAAHKLTAAFLLCLCLQQSANHFSMPALRRLLLQTANQLQILVWVSHFRPTS